MFTKLSMSVQRQTSSVDLTSLWFRPSTVHFLDPTTGDVLYGHLLEDIHTCLACERSYFFLSLISQRC